jgi:MFS family permease
VLAVFPVTMRATLSSAFLAGSVVGQMAGVMVGGQVAAAHGWRAAFEVIGVAGLVLAVLYPLVVRESRLGTPPLREKLDWSLLGRQLLGRRVMLLTYFASGIQLFCTGTLAVFLPLLLTRHYGMKIDQAGQTTALFLLICAVGMVVCGIVTDRVARNHPAQKPRVAMLFSLTTAVLFAGAFFSAPGPVQLALLGAGLFVVAGNAGIAGAMIANLTPRPIHSTAMAVLALSYNLLGLAPGPVITGWLSDQFGLLDALKILPLPCLLCAAAMAFARSDYARAIAPTTDSAAS